MVLSQDSLLLYLSVMYRTSALRIPNDVKASWPALGWRVGAEAIKEGTKAITA